MQGKAVWATLSKYIASLVMTILAPLQWVRAWKVAGQHHALDPRGQKKIVAGIVAGLALTAVSAYVVVDFQQDATQGAYETLSGRLSGALGNDFYNDQVQARDAALALIDTADRKISEAQAAGDAEAEQTWRNNKEQYQKQVGWAQTNITTFQTNHQLWLEVNGSLLNGQDDGTAKALIAANAGLEGVDEERAAAHFDKKDETVSDMQSMLNWFVYPGLIGVLWAPVAFASGHVLKTTYVPSDTVGYKPYPGGAASLFLLFGAFGVPALFFAAWVMQDFADRTEVGQISL